MDGIASPENSLQDAVIEVESFAAEPLLSYESRIENTLCERCSTIPWAELLPGENFKVLGRDVVSVFDQPWCCFCRFMKHYTRLGAHPADKRKVVSSNFCHRVDESCAYLSKMEGEPQTTREALPVRYLVSETEPYSSNCEVQQYFPRKLNFANIVCWIKSCESKHGVRCAPSTQHISSLQVIDCMTRHVVVAPVRCQYVALSYVWGPGRPASDNTNLSQDLPKTIEDSIHLTRALGYRYLWIDRYCIHQDNSAAQNLQIGQMGSIYAAAQLVIVDAVGHDPTKGLPGVQSDRGANWIQHGSIYLTALPAICTNQKSIEESPWASRAWTFQEGFLAKRRLVFTQRQAVFICNTDTCSEAKNLESEAYLNAARWLPPQGGVTEFDPLTRAMEYVFEYSKRTLTYEADALKAIVGALNTLRNEHVYHLWGVPYASATRETSCLTSWKSHESKTYACDSRRNTGFALLWHHGCPEIRRPGFPSWSPLAWTGIPYFYPAPNAIEAFVTVRTSGISLHEHGQPLSSSVPDLSRAVPQLLEIYTETSHLNSGADSSSPLGFTHFCLEGAVVVLPFNDEVNVFIYPNWSIDVSLLQNTNGLKGMLVRVSDQGSQDWIIILQSCGAYYERIGIFQPPAFSPLALADDEPWRNTVFRDRNSRVLSSASLAYVQMEEAYERDGCYLGRKWRDLFTPETILLG